MTWKTHKLMTATAVLAATGNPLWTFLATMGSVIPDGLEFLFYGHNVPHWKHRRITHWPVPYFALALVFYLISAHLPLYHTLSFTLSSFSSELHNFIVTLKNANLSLGHTIPIMGFWLSLGALLHILEDALSGKVPLWNPKRKTFGVLLVQTRSFLESLLFVFLLLAFALVSVWQMRGGG